MLAWLRPKRRCIVFVCTANVCRSPLAQALLREELLRRGAGRSFSVVSAGTRVGQPGRPADPRLRPFLASRGVPFPRSRARPVTPALLAEAERVCVMTAQHREELAALVDAARSGRSGPGDGGARTVQALGEGVLDKVLRLGDYLAQGEAGDIADPYFADGDTYREVQEQIERAVTALAGELLAAP